MSANSWKNKIIRPRLAEIKNQTIRQATSTWSVNCSVDEASQPHADTAVSEEEMQTMDGPVGVSLSSLTTSNAAGEPALT